MRKLPFSVVLLACFSIAMAAAQVQDNSADDLVRLNQIQVIGTHNSYHAGFAPNEAKLWKEKSPKAFHGLEYHHAPLSDQLSSGIRQIEIDVFADTKGGLYAHPAGPRLVAQAGLQADPDFDSQHEMEKPGFKVLHVQDLDYRSTCLTFVDCLTTVREWSHAHPSHLPIFILVETKQGDLKLSFPTVHPEQFTPEIFDALDAEILSVFSPTEIITPDQVRGKHETLDQAIRSGGWPTLKESRGKVIFLMDQKKMGPIYLQEHASLKGRILFSNADPGSPDAAFTEQNNGSVDEINELVRQGYLVRTRTDDNTEQARTNDTSSRDAVLASGAQILSTDYPTSEPSQWTGYSVSLPDGLIARCNPVLKPAGCISSALDPDRNHSTAAARSSSK